MIYYENEYKLMPFVASYTQSNEQIEQHVPNKEELLAYEDMGHITDLSFKSAEYTNEQQQRLTEIKDYPQSEYQTVYDYVIDNKVKQGTTLAESKNKDMLLTALADIDTQREQDKLEQQLALAEMAEMLTGGMF